LISTSPKDREMLRCLTRDISGAMAPEVAERLGVSESAVRSRMSRLREAGWIEVSYCDTFAFYKLTREGKRERAE
jgi:predicted ArsR family transcriptional regulator